MYDIYVLAHNRTWECAKCFLDVWAKDFVPTAEQYEFPQYSNNPKSVYSEPVDLIERLIEESNQPHAIYWENPARGAVQIAMLFFTDDDGMIAGLTVRSENLADLEKLLKSLANDVNGKYGVILFEQPPPHSKEDFVRCVIASNLPKLG